MRLGGYSRAKAVSQPSDTSGLQRGEHGTLWFCFYPFAVKVDLTIAVGSAKFSSWVTESLSFPLVIANLEEVKKPSVFSTKKNVSMVWPMR